MKNEHHVSGLKVVLAFAAIYLVWGSTYLAILLAIKSIPPFFMIAARFLIAGMLLFSWCLLKKYPLPSITLLLKNSLAGILMLCFGTGAVTWVEQYLSSGLTAIIVAMAPIWFVLLDKRKWHFHLSNKKIIFGLLIGLAGVALLFSDSATFNLQGNRMQFVSIFVMIFGSLMWVSGSLYSKYHASEGASPVNTAVQMLAAGAALLVIGFAFGEHHILDLQKITWELAMALVYQIIFGSLLAYMAYVWLLTVRTPSLVGTYALVNPAVAVFLGWLIADEKIMLNQVIALLIILSGVVMVTFTKRPSA